VANRPQGDGVADTPGYADEGTPTTRGLYLDEGSTALTDPAAIDALTDVTASGTTAYACSTSGSGP
jgi:hypothetical protein